jgi:hypothetical protein
MILRNQNGSHFKSPNESSKKNDKGGVITKSQKGTFISAGDAKLIIEEIQEILSLENDDPVLIVETVRKLEKVVKAVPRMENFISNICK